MATQDVILHIHFYPWHKDGDDYAICTSELVCAGAVKVGEATVAIHVPDFKTVKSTDLNLKRLAAEEFDLTAEYQAKLAKIKQRVEALLKQKDEKKC